jgi:amidase
VPHVPYWAGFSAAQQQIMLDAIEALRGEGAFVGDPYEIPNQAAISAFGICTSFPAPSNCSTVLMYGQKHDLNNYLATRPSAPVHTLADIIAFNNAHAAVALKYGQAIFLAANQLDTNPGSADTQRYLADRALDLALLEPVWTRCSTGPMASQARMTTSTPSFFHRTAAQPHQPRQVTRALWFLAASFRRRALY